MMATLILRERSTGQEIERQEIHPEARYSFYAMYAAHELVTSGNRRFRIETIAWRRPEAELVLGVTFDSWVPDSYNC
jgi:hypothetical protein